MAGYKPPRKIYTITFDSMPGFVMKCIGASLGQLFEITETELSLSADNRVNVSKAFDFLATRIVEWNMEHPDLDPGLAVCTCGLKPGDALPPAAENLKCLDPALVLEILFGWVDIVARVNQKKETSTENGANDTPATIAARMLEQLANAQSLSVSQEPS